jgi:hypothetical protein
MLESRGQILDTWLILKTSISGPKRKSVGANKNIFINNEAAFLTWGKCCGDTARVKNLTLNQFYFHSNYHF